MNSVPIALFWLLFAWAAISRAPVSLYLYFATMPVGAFAVIPPPLTGGLTFTAAPIIALLLIGQAFVNRRGPSRFLALALLPDRLMLLFGFWIVAAVATLFMPRLFAGDIPVIAVRGVPHSTVPLRTSVQNLSQFVYMTIAVLSVFAFARMLRTPEMRQHALRALCLGAIVTVATGLADYASQFLPLKPLLAPFRTATYSLLTEVEVMGGKRVVGLMPEASAYGTLCLGFLSLLYFFRRAIPDPRWRDLFVPALLAMLLLCAWLSTSSGTYVGVVLLVLIAGVEWFLRVNTGAWTSEIYRRGLFGELSVVAFLLIAVTVLLLLQPHVLEPIYALVDRMVLKKTASHSFEERGMWRAVSVAALVQSQGLGIGLGSTRSSSSLVAIFSGTGLLGGLLYSAFVLQCFLRSSHRTTVEAQVLVSAFRFSFIPMFVISLTNAEAVFDGFVAFGFGLTAALASARRSPAWPTRETGPPFAAPRPHDLPA